VSTHASSQRTVGDYPDLRAVVDVARRGWWAVALAAALFAALAALAGSRHATRYEASARVLVGPVAGPVPDVRAAGERAPTYAELATSGRVVAAARARLRLAAAPARLVQDVKARSDGNRLITITADAPDPSRAAALANAVAAELGPAILRAPGAAAREFHVVDPAVPPRAAVATHRNVVTVFAAFAGALAGLTLLLLVDYFRGRITRAEDLAEVTGAPLLAVLDPAAGTGYDVLAARIALAGRRTAVRSILIAGDAAEDVAERLAAAMEADGTPVHRVTAPTAPAEARRALRRKYDPRILVVAAPAPDRFPAAVACTRFVDSTILVARQARTSRDSAAQWADALRQVGGSLLGTALYARPRRLRALAAWIDAAPRAPRRRAKAGAAEAA
jgi:capsular polysaccharide biosynthesis protein